MKEFVIKVQLWGISFQENYINEKIMLSLYCLESSNFIQLSHFMHWMNQNQLYLNSWIKGRRFSSLITWKRLNWFKLYCLFFRVNIWLSCTISKQNDKGRKSIYTQNVFSQTDMCFGETNPTTDKARYLVPTREAQILNPS